MNYIVEKIKKILYSKRKQILFALFALLCFILDKDNSGIIVKCAAPAVVAGAAKGAAAVSKGAAAVKGTAAASSALATAESGVTKAASQAVNAKQVVNTANNKKINEVSRLNNNGPKNTNPKYNGLQAQPHRSLHCCKFPQARPELPHCRGLRDLYVRASRFLREIPCLTAL